MGDLAVGDRIILTFDDAPQQQITARVSRMVSDREKGLSPETEDYVACWLEISPQAGVGGTTSSVLVLTDGRYSLDGRFVTVRKDPS